MAEENARAARRDPLLAQMTSAIAAALDAEKARAQTYRATGHRTGALRAIDHLRAALLATEGNNPDRHGASPHGTCIDVSLSPGHPPVWVCGDRCPGFPGAPR